MRLLLDTHIFIWWTQNDRRLPGLFLDAISAPHNSIHVSAATAWEIGIKRKIGKLGFSGSVEEAIRRHRFSALSIAVRHAEGAGALPMLHNDPFDRLLIAQAQLEMLVLVSADKLITQYEVPHL